VLCLCERRQQGDAQDPGNHETQQRWHPQNNGERARARIESLCVGQTPFGFKVTVRRESLCGLESIDDGGAQCLVLSSGRRTRKGEILNIRVGVCKMPFYSDACWERYLMVSFAL